MVPVTSAIKCYTRYMKHKRSVMIGSVVLVVILMLVGAAYFYRDDLVRLYLSPTDSTVEQGAVETKPEVVARDLETPWSIAFLPDGDMLITERSGELQRIGEDGQTFTIEGVQETSEGGLLGVTLAPDFEQSVALYLYYTTNRNGTMTNQVDRYIFAGNRLSERTEIITDIPAASNHNGGAIAFGPDDKLYVTTGDAAEPELAQSTDSLAGKILRINPDGSTPNDNPFDNPVWSYGHRNPQGIAWDEEGRLWSVEHGQSSQDELNLIERGANYGWPTIRGDETSEGMRGPVVHSGNTDTWAPSGLAYNDGSLYFAGLRGQSLYRAELRDSDNVTLTQLFAQEYGRLRAVTAHEDTIYFSTSNRDGRGSPASDDDQILRIPL